MTQAIVPKELLAATLGGLSLLVVSGGSDGQVLTQQADGTYAPESVSVGVSGSTGATDNAILRANGTGGATLQSSAVTIDDNGAITTGGLTISPVNGAVTFGQTFSILFQSSNSVIWRHGNNDGFYVRPLSGSGTLATGGYGVIGFLNSANTLGGYITISSNGVIAMRDGASAGAALTLASLTASGLVSVGVYTFATVPSASSNIGTFLRISDRAQKHAYSDGTNWRFFGDDAIIS